MNSMRLINIGRLRIENAEFVHTYATCTIAVKRDGDPLAEWRVPLHLLMGGASTTIWLCEPNTKDNRFLEEIQKVIIESFRSLSPEGGYYDLPEVRDVVARELRLPEAAFDEGLNALLDLPRPPFSLGLQYERISGRRRPLQRTGSSGQIFNLIRSQ